MKIFFTKYFIPLVFISVFLFPPEVSAQWYKDYNEAEKLIKRSDYSGAITLLRKALEGNDSDKERVRTYGMHFQEYYPNRELGVCYYHIGDIQNARHYLNISMKQETSKRAKDYLDKIESGGTQVVQQTPVMKPPQITPAVTPPGNDDLIVGQKTVKLVGERLSVAVFPFENKGASKDLGEIILDKMITVLHQQGRFEIMERSQLSRVLEEQQLGMTGIVEATTAAQIGKSIGVDAIVLGSVAAASSGAISVDARVIDTESAAIVSAEDAYSGSSDIQSVKNTVENLARKLTEALPLVEGYIIRNDGDKLTLDTGRNGGLNKGMKCVVYKEGAEIKHPITGEVLGKQTVILGEILITDVFSKFSVAKILSTDNQSISIGDRFLTK